MNGKTVTAFVLGLIVLAGVIWYFSGGSPSQTSKNAPAAQTTPATGTAAPSPTGATSVNPQSKNVTVTYTDNGFSPATVTIPEGATVTWVNQSGNPMWVAVNVHPSHTEYDGTTRAVHCATGYTGAKPFDECAAIGAGGSYSFTFDKAGTWPYHNHAGAEDTGTVIVTSGAGGTPNGTL